MDIRLALMTGADIPIPECQITLHQPTIKEISLLGEQEFFTGLQCLTLNKTMFTQDNSVLDNVNNFQIFMTIMGDQQSADKKQAVKNFFLLIFPSYKFMFSPRSLIVQQDQNTFTIDETNFEALQNILREVFCAKNGPMDQQSFNPANDKAKEIADKLMRGRQRVAAQNGTANASVFSQYVSTLSIGLHLSIRELSDYTMFQLFDAVERYLLYVNWDIDIRSRLAGAKGEKQPDNWMKNIH